MLGLSLIPKPSHWETMTRQERIDYLKAEIDAAKAEIKADHTPYQRESAKSYLASLARQLNGYYDR